MQLLSSIITIEKHGIFYEEYETDEDSTILRINMAAAL